MTTIISDSKLSDNKKIYTARDLDNRGVTSYARKKLLQDGKLMTVASGVYENTGFNGEESDFYYAAAIAPAGVICLMSAAVYYGLSTYRPDAVDVAIERNHKVKRIPEWPPINIVYFSEKRMELGVKEVEAGGDHFRIFDPEKTVVDLIFYRNKIGIEETREVLTNYLRREDSNISLLYDYARELHCAKTLSTYMEVLV